MKEDNELIAKFMGHPIDYQYDRNFPSKRRVKRSLKYDTSWDSLMPVVSKIAEYRMAYPKASSWVCDCKIVVYRHLLYREVVNFIKWYNAENP